MNDDYTQDFINEVKGALNSGGGDKVKITDGYQLFVMEHRIDEIDKFDLTDCINFSKMFSNCTGLTSIPELNTSNGTDFSNMFNNCTGLTSIPELNTSNGTNFGYMFARCSGLTSIPELNTSNGTNFAYMFSECTGLTSIQKLDLDKATVATSIFYNCKNLADLKIYNIRIALFIGGGTSRSNVLTADSLVHTIQELCYSSSSKTLAIGSENLARISDLYCKVIDDTVEKKTMELCESTDDGAMLVTDYVQLKNWKLS